MKSRFAYILLAVTLFTACTQQQLNQSAAIVLPIAEAAAATYGAQYDIPPAATASLIGGTAQLFGMSSVAYQGQPPSTGTDLAPVAAAVLSKTPSGTSEQQAAVLLAAAQYLQNKAKATPAPATGASRKLPTLYYGDEVIQGAKIVYRDTQ